MARPKSRYHVNPMRVFKPGQCPHCKHYREAEGKYSNGRAFRIRICLVKGYEQYLVPGTMERRCRYYEPQDKAV